MNAFWKKFLTDTYEQKPAVFSAQEAGSCFFFEEEALKVFTSIFSDCAASGYPSLSHRCHINGRLLEGKHPKSLIPFDNENFQEFVNRVIKERGDVEDIAFVSHNWHAHSETFYEMIRDFVSPIVEECGIPSALFGTDMFAGKYRSTPHGIHKDTAGVFIFPVIGKKTMYVWPFETFETFETHQEDAYYTNCAISDSYTDHLGKAIKLEAHPGEVIYIPQSWWHISVNEEHITNFTLNISSHMFSNEVENIEAISQTLLKQGLSYTGHIQKPKVTQKLNLSDITLPETTLNYLQELEVRLKLDLLRRMSKDGFLVSPATATTEADISLEGKYFLGRKNTLFLVDLGDKLSLVANGSIFKFNYSKALENMIEDILQGKMISMASLPEECRELFLTLIEKGVLREGTYHIEKLERKIQNYLEKKGTSAPLVTLKNLSFKDVDDLDDIELPVDLDLQLNEMEDYLQRTGDL